MMGRYTLTIKEGSKGSRKISFTSIEEMKEMGTTIISLAENLRSDES
ncbi:MAG: hypothetical protein K9L56_15375 [Clostridiales bacterium]|nr:hypothetical protein [Clostridiales bacterium]